MDELLTIKDFQEWFKKNLKITLNESDKNHYKSASREIKEKFEKSNFWTEFTQSMPTLNKEYYFETDYYLYKDEYKPEIIIKPYQSLPDKTYRKNHLLNTNFPEAPDNGWVTPNDWFETINDIVRTTLVVRYLDGVEFIIKKLKKLADDKNLKFNSNFEAKEEGYYAAHNYITMEFEIPTKTWATKKSHTQIEIKITTELQSNIERLIHKYYETNRLSKRNRNKKWQWDYQSPEFSVNYLGHILHYVEGMIMEIRSKK